MLLRVSIKRMMHGSAGPDGKNWPHLGHNYPRALAQGHNWPGGGHNCPMGKIQGHKFIWLL